MGASAVGRRREWLSLVAVASCGAAFVWPVPGAGYLLPVQGLLGIATGCAVAGWLADRWRAERLGWLAWHLVMLALAYAAMELAFAGQLLRLAAQPTVAWQAAVVAEMNSYVLDRSYQYFAIIALAVLIWWWHRGTGGSVPHAVRIGDGAVTTGLLGGAAPLPWRTVTWRIGLMIAVVGGAGAALRALAIADPARLDAAWWAGLATTMIGSCNNGVIEELVFRGLLLSSLAVGLGATRANHAQAILFSVIHFVGIGEGTTSEIATEAFRLGIYYLIGLLFGRATLDTRGIGVPAALHGWITAVIWLNVRLARVANGA